MYEKPYHKFRDQSADQIEELFSNYIIDSLSYSKISTFCRNEKAFEMQYVYRINGKSSATTIAGTAYHEALKLYFECLAGNITLDIVALETRAFQVINETPANLWKLQKTCSTPSLPTFRTPRGGFLQASWYDSPLGLCRLAGIALPRDLMHDLPLSAGRCVPLDADLVQLAHSHAQLDDAQEFRKCCWLRLARTPLRQAS